MTKFSTINKNARRERFNANARLVAKSDPSNPDGPGFLEGYLAVFGNVDSQGEIIRKGAFLKSIKQLSNVPLMAKHFAAGGDTIDCIGSITQAKEDNFGLWIHAVFSSDPFAQAIRTRVNEGHVKGLSVGFFPVSYQARPAVTDEETAVASANYRDEIIEWTECTLCEGTVTVRPANIEAGITSSKARRNAKPSMKAARFKRQRELESMGIVTVSAAHKKARRKREMQMASLGVR